jgi:hypothetical protein
MMLPAFSKLIFRLLSATALVVVVGSEPAMAQKSVQNTDVPSVNSFDQMETESLEFVQEHHPELVALLESLKSMREKEYEIAIREIFRSKKRLDGFVKRDTDIYNAELDAWKIQSKIDLLVAKGIAREKEVDKVALRALLKDQMDNQKKRWKHEITNLAKRQEQLTGLLSAADGHEEEKIEQQLAALQKRVDSKIGKSKKQKQDAKSSP